MTSPIETLPGEFSRSRQEDAQGKGCTKQLIVPKCKHTAVKRIEREIITEEHQGISNISDERDIGLLVNEQTTVQTGAQTEGPYCYCHKRQEILLTLVIIILPLSLQDL